MAALPDYPDAFQSIRTGPWRTSPIETVGLAEAPGRVLAEPLLADRDLPPFDRSAMDGYAVRSKDLEEADSLPSAGFIAAGDSDPPEVPSGYCVGIATGAPVPPQLDAVAPHEWTDRGDPVSFERKPETGNAIHHRGSDASAGDELVSSGTRMGPVEIGLAATVGTRSIPVYRRPTIMLLSSGDEVVAIDVKPGPSQIRNSNLPMIAHLLERMGGDVIDEQWLPDDVALTRRTLETCEADMIITIGGISAGDRDAFKEAIDSLQTTMLLKGAAIQPGRPIQVAAINGNRPLISLPGNPVSALATACLFAWPILRMMQGLTPDLPWSRGVLSESAGRHRSRRRFRPVKRDGQGGLVVPHWQGSGDLSHATDTIGLADLAAGEQMIEEGTPVNWLPWP
ncbi:MAG: molybdopterin molybdenumtransferase MoeA [Phycisphaerae bacterium]|nr:molybdopterin molybdenumtransferase MoeA [Phycisphaerae bacterium]